MNLLDLVFDEYFAVAKKLLIKTPVTNDKMIVDSKLFYSFLDKNLYIKP